MAGNARDILIRFLGDKSDLSKSAKGAAEDVQGAVDKVGAAADSSKLSGARGKFGAVFDELKSSSPAAGSALDGVTGKLSVGIPTAAGAAAGAIAAFALDGARDFVETAKSAQNLATTMGGTTEQSSRWLEVLRPLGVELGDAQDIFGNMASLVQSNDAAFAQLGVSIARAEDGTVDMNETTIRVVEALGRVKDGSERAALAQKLFGEQGSRQFTPLIGKADELRDSLNGVSGAFVITEAEAKKAGETEADFRELTAAIREMKLELGQALLDFKDFAQGLGRKGAKVNDALGIGIEDELQVLAYRLEMKRLAKNLEEANAAHTTSAEATQQATLRQVEAREAARALSEQTGAIAKANDQMRLAAVSAREEMEVGEEKTRDLVEAQKKQAEWAQIAADAEGRRADRTRDAYRAAVESVDPILRERAANRDLADAADDVAEKTKAAQDAKFKDAEKNGEVVSAQDDLITKLTNVAGAYVTAKGASVESKDGAQLYVDKLTELRDQYGPALGPAIAIYDDLIERIRTTITEQERANRTVPGFEADYGSGTGVKRRADGGPVRRGEPYIVGEEGQELFVPDQSGVVVPNDVLTRATSGRPVSFAAGAGPAQGVTVQVFVQGSVLSERELIEVVRNGLIRTNRITGGQLFAVSGAA